jgi:hypothetical protein
MDVQDAATTLARTLHPLGLLSRILTDRQWGEYPGNTTTDPQGQVQIAPRYTPTAYTELGSQMTSVTLYIAKESNDRLQQRMDVSRTKLPPQNKNKQKNKNKNKNKRLSANESHAPEMNKLRNWIAATHRPNVRFYALTRRRKSDAMCRAKGPNHSPWRLNKCERSKSDSSSQSRRKYNDPR